MSGEMAVKARGIGKRYPLYTQGSQADYLTLSETLAHCARFPLRWLAKRSTPETQRSFWALRDIDFDVKHGEVIGIVGRNGNGKSTLLKILSKITSPTLGTIDMQGRVCSLLEVGTGFHPELTGSENIFLNGSILGMSRREIRQKYDEIVAFSEVEQFLNMPVKRYSSGMRVRLAFSVAAHLDPDILIIDEVLAVGDLAFQQKCLKRMSEFASTGRTILFVSHNMPAIESICKRTMMLSCGQIVADGPTHEVVPQFVKSMVESESEIGAADIDLADHPRRNRICQPILKRLRVLDASGTPSATLPLGGNCSFELQFHSPTIQNGLGFSINISTDQGQKVAVLHSRINSRVVTTGQAAGIVRCHVNELPLLPSKYNIDVAAGTWDQTLDAIEQATSITMVPTDYFQTGELFGAGQGVIAIKGNWTSIQSETPKPHLDFAPAPTSVLSSQPPVSRSESFSIYDWR